MEVAEPASRTSTSLPSISMLDAKRADSVATPVSFMMPSASSSFSHLASGGAIAVPPPGLASPPRSRRTSGDGQDQGPAPAPAPGRISLPSIHETLRNETPTSYTVQPPPPVGSAYYQPPASQPHSPPDSGRRQYLREQPKASAPNSAMANGYMPRNTSPYMRHAEVVPPPPSTAYSQPERPAVQIPSSRLPSLHPIQTSSPVEAPRYSYGQQNSPHDIHPPAPSHSLAQPAAYPHYQQHPPTAAPTSIPPPQPAFGRPAPPPAPFPAGYQRVEEGKRASLIPGQAYGESVKRHLETFDYEASLNEIADTNTQLLEFANQYRRLAHQSQRTGLLPGTSPGVPEIDDMIRKAQMVQDALRRVKDVVMAQNVAATEQLAQEERYKGQNGFHPEPHSEYQEDSKTSGFLGSDPKKRRGRAAPPGRCHSCNRAETPEWRRGPDGARTLCNACGLHYAKLTRKMGGSNKQPVGGSNLRPKGPDSPTVS